LPDQWKQSIIVPVHKEGDKTISTSYKMLSNIRLSTLKVHTWTKLLGIINVSFDATYQLLSSFSCFAFVRHWGKKWECNETVHQLFIVFKKAYESVRRKVLYNTLIDLGVPIKLVRLIKMCLNETYSKVCGGKHLSNNFPIQNGLKEGDVLSPLLFNFALAYAIRKVQEARWD
jgi:hypothetical protein